MFGIRFVMVCKNAPDNVLIQLQTKGDIDLLGYAGTAVSWIALFHRNDGVDDFFGWSFGTCLPPTTGPNQLSQGCEQVEKQISNISHIVRG